MTIVVVVGQPTVGCAAEPDWAALADRIVEKLEVRHGETFAAIVNPAVHEQLVPHLRRAVASAGGTDVGPIDASSPPDRQALRDIDATVMLPGAVPGMPVYAAIQDLLRERVGRNIHFHWLSNSSAIPVPDGRLPSTEIITATYERAVLAVDYEAMAARQRAFEAAMRGAKVQVTSPAGTDLRFRIGDRPVSLQNGDASAARVSAATILIDRELELPAGVVRVAPIESSVEGLIAFPPSEWNGVRVEGLRLRFEDGRVVEISADRGREAAVAEIIEAGAAGRAFREFALGFNPLLAIPDEAPWIPYYGYGAGVVRLSLGDNTELGGAVTTVTVGGETWVRDGKLVPGYRGATPVGGVSAEE
jgi:hypothetical protein